MYFCLCLCDYTLIHREVCAYNYAFLLMHVWLYTYTQTLTISYFWNVGGHDSPHHVRWVPQDCPLWKTQFLPLLMVVRSDLTLRPHYWRFYTFCTGHVEIKLGQTWKLSFCLLAFTVPWGAVWLLISSVPQQFYSAVNSGSYSNGVKVKGVTNYYLIGFKAHSASGNLSCYCELSQESVAQEVMALGKPTIILL